MDLTIFEGITPGEWATAQTSEQKFVLQEARSGLKLGLIFNPADAHAIKWQ